MLCLLSPQTHRKASDQSRIKTPVGELSGEGESDAALEEVIKGLVLTQQEGKSASSNSVRMQKQGRGQEGKYLAAVAQQ